MKKLFIVCAILACIFLLAGCDEVEKAKKDAQSACNNDGVVQAPELCDDANTNAADTCDQCFPTYCGDNNLNNDPFNFNRTTEYCDNEDSSEANAQCFDQNFTLGCNQNTCQCSGPPPPPPACNQNKIVDAGEQCDDGPLGSSKCTKDCQLTYCGDGKVQAPNGLNLANAVPGFNEVCDAGPNPNNLTDPTARAAHAFCQTALVDPLAACVGCKCQAPPWSCTAGAFAAAFGGGPLAPIPPTAVCKDDCAANFGPKWKCDAVTCACKPPPPPPTPTCADNTVSVAFGGKALKNLPAVCKDDCKDLAKAFGVPNADVVCDQKTCTCIDKKAPKNGTTTCAGNSFAVALGGESSWKQGDTCKDDCAEVAKAFGDTGEGVYCDVTSCTCKDRDEERVENATVSCAANEQIALLGGTPEMPSETKLCKDDCKLKEGEYAYCEPETCVCQRRPITPRCGDGYISSKWVAGGGSEECDLGGAQGYGPAPDTCPAGKVCSMSDPACTCVDASDLVEDVCPEGTGTSPACYNQCYPNEACQAVTYTPTSETPCYTCVPKCPFGTFLNKQTCEVSYNLPCAQAVPGCYAPVQPEGEEDIGSLPGTDVTEGQGEEEVIGGGGDTEPQPLDCESECAQRGRSTQQPNYGSYILGQLNSYSCVSGASIGVPGILTLRGPAGDSCTCYAPANEATVNVDSTPPVCNTACGEVACGGSAECSCGEGCTQSVSCNWGGWEQVGALQFQPVIAGAED